MDVKLLVSYNIKPNLEAEYYRYVLSEYLPALQNLGLYMVEGWHTAFGQYPVRLIGFQANTDAELREIIKGAGWQESKEKLLNYVRDYEERLVEAKNVFQFFVPGENS